MAVSVACMAIYWPTLGFKGRTFKLCVLTRWDFNFCVRSSPLRELVFGLRVYSNNNKSQLLSGACTELLELSLSSILLLVCRAPWRNLLTWWQLVSQLVLWAQSQRITSGLKTNFSLPPSYSFHESLYHKSPFLKPQLKFCQQIRNANPEKQQHMFWSLIIFRGHLTREPASRSVTSFILRASRRTGVSHS